MKIENIKRKIKKIQNLLLEIIERLNLQFEETPTISNIANFLQTNQYMSEFYSNKLKSLDSLSELVNLKKIYGELNDLELYLLTRFYHYI